MNRRRALLSIAGVSSLAGCSSSIKGAVRTGPPYFEEVEISGDDEVAVGDGVKLEISVKNTGGREGDFTGTLTLGSGPFSIEESVVIEDVPVSHSKSTTIGPFQPPYAEEYKFRITDHDAEHTLTAVTAEVSQGETVSLSDLSISVGGHGVRESIIRGAREEYEIVSPRGVFLTVDVEVDAEGDTSPPPSTSFSVAGDEGTTERLYPRDGQKMPYGESSPGQGYLVFDASRAELDNGVSVAYAENSDDEPEAVWEFEGIPAPNTYLEELDYPSSAEIDTEYEVSITAGNDGDASGRFHAIIDIETDRSYGGWEPIWQINEEIDPGGTATVSFTDQGHLLPGRTYRVRTKDGSIERGSVSITPRELTVGEAYSFGGDWEVTLNSVKSVLADSVAYGTGYMGEIYEAEDGFGFLLAHATLANTGGDGLPPTIKSFSAIHKGQGFDVLESSSIYVELTEPVEGDEFGYYLPGKGEAVSGWIPIEVPDSLNPQSTAIKCAPTGFGSEAPEDAVIWRT